MRPLIQAICAPVLGFQVGEELPPEKLVILCEMLPLMSEIQIWYPPVREEAKASCWPLGDHAGEISPPRAEG